MFQTYLDFFHSLRGDNHPSSPKAKTIPMPLSDKKFFMRIGLIVVAFVVYIYMANSFIYNLVTWICPLFCLRSIDTSTITDSQWRYHVYYLCSIYFYVGWTILELIGLYMYHIRIGVSLCLFYCSIYEFDVLLDFYNKLDLYKNMLWYSCEILYDRVNQDYNKIYLQVSTKFTNKKIQ